MLVAAAAPPTVSTHILDTSTGSPAPAVPVELAAADKPEGPWRTLGGSATDEDGRCRDLPAPPAGADGSGTTVLLRLRFDTGAYHRRRGTEAFFPEVAVTFAAEPGQHYHVPLLLNPFGYSVYRGS
ncbi:hydroxyisourate hydrolase [Mangrovactinospora gilvigrisea]|uniref:5-hydroxyisourate hydrolase n=1 Tax=Mangrovactinospora gilvigrisea TaxID=1428644 RepID=A0A1J7C8G0_9ACTN|nr:hydroxyisourate hydrolase [Mangrovactinospora gilvigrisea]